MHTNDPRRLHPSLSLMVAALAATMLMLACGGEAEDDKPDGADGGVGGATHGGGAGGTGAPDLLDLASCDPLSDQLPDPTTVPVASWGSTDEHAVMCSLRVLDEPLANSEIVCLGENSHGVAESTRWHTLMARYLVHRLGFRTIALETTRPSAAFWNRYLQSGEAADLAKGFEDAVGSLGNSVEAELLVKALAEVQKELPEDDPITLAGFDVAVQPRLTRGSLLDFIETVLPAEHAKWSAALPLYTGGVDWKAAGDAASELLQQFEKNAADYIAQTDPDRYDGALIDATNLRDGYYFLGYLTVNDFATGNATFREPGMIRNIERLRGEGDEAKKLVLLAHNFHCAEAYSIGTTADGKSSPAFGTYLANTYGPQYQTIAQFYLAGSELVQQNGIKSMPFTASPQFVEAAIGDKTASDALLVGTKPNDAGDSMLPFDQLWPTQRNILQVIADQYDLLLWLRGVEAKTIRP